MEHHIICYSGGHSSARVAIEVSRKYGTSNMILLNHDIATHTEDPDIKRFKSEVAAWLGLPVTYANMTTVRGTYGDSPPVLDQFDISIQEQAFKTRHDQVICTNRLKTGPFEAWLEQNTDKSEAVIYYGFDEHEKDRILRRSTFLAAKGYKTAFPLAHWPSTIKSTTEIGIEPPMTYGLFKHANCTGCIKGGRQHWYVVFCTRSDIWQKAKDAEDQIGHHIVKGVFLTELEPMFKRMRCAGIAPTEHIPPQTFWATARNILKNDRQVDLFTEQDQRPCECVI